MAFDFPANPALGDVYSPVGGLPYVWDGVVWMAQASSSGASGFVLKAGDIMTGALIIPPGAPVQPAEAAHKTYVDQNTLYQGVWLPATNVPDLTPSASILAGYAWTAKTANPAVQEAPPAGLPGLSGTMVSNADTIAWDGSSYAVIRPPLAPAAGTNGDVKSGFQTADHNGWILLDGRAVSTLTTSQQTVAASLGFTANLPNAAYLVMMQNGGAMGAITGSMNKKISQAMLPAVTLTSSSVDTAVATTSSGPSLSAAVLGQIRGRSATGGTGYYFLDAEGDNVRSIAHTHTVDIPNHSHTTALGGSGADFDVTPKAMAICYFVFLGL